MKNQFYFKHRNIGLNPDTNKYYFLTIKELISKIDILNETENSKIHISWSVSKMSNDNQYALMSDFWTTETRGTDIPLKCKGWWVHGYIYTDETNKNIYDLFSVWEADYTNHFIQRKYISPDEFSNLTDLQKEKCIKDGGIILNKKDW